MGLLTKVIIVATLTVALIACTAIAISINSPQGALFVGSTYPISWTPNENETGIIGICPQSNTNSCNNIDSNVDLSKGTYNWVVTGSPGSYVFFINDGTGEKFSGPFQITTRGGSASSGPTQSGSSNSSNTASATESSTPNETTNGAAGTTPTGTGTNATPTSGSNTGASTPTSTKSSASTLRSSLLGLFVGLGVIASVMIQLF